MISEIDKNAIEVVKKFNKENRFRDTGIINNSIDLLLALVNKQEKENEVLRLKLRQLKRTRDLLSENWDLIFNDNEEEDTDI
jgi:hypothetical protein